MEEFGDRLHFCLKQLGHSNLSEFSRLIGWDRGTLNQILLNRNKPGFNKIAQLLEVLDDVNPDFLISNKGHWRRIATGEAEDVRRTALLKVESLESDIKEALSVVAELKRMMND